MPPKKDDNPRVQKCPICEAPIGRRGENPTWPFCGERCKMVDLGRWLGEEYAIGEPLRFPAGPGKDRSN